MSDVVPDAVGVVTGWRAWSLHSDGRLRSPMKWFVWTPRERAVANCEFVRLIEVSYELTRKHSALLVRSLPMHEDGKKCPGVNCGCGFYAVENKAAAYKYAPPDDPSTWRVTGKPVLGRVHLWGKIIPGTKGWRAQYAYPAELYVPKGVSQGEADRLSELYGVPVTRCDLRKLVYPVFPSRSPQSLFKWTIASLVFGIAIFDAHSAIEEMIGGQYLLGALSAFWCVCLLAMSFWTTRWP